jgi:hypothetical protein
MYDNCPRCNKSVILEHGFSEGAYEVSSSSEPGSEDTEIVYGTCNICGTKFRIREEFSEKKGYPVAIYEEWACLIPELNLRVVKTGPLLCRWWKLKEKPVPVAVF